MRKGNERRLSDERWFTISEVSRRLGFSRAKVYALIAGYVGEDGIEAGVAYRWDPEAARFVKVVQP